MVEDNKTTSFFVLPYISMFIGSVWLRITFTTPMSIVILSCWSLLPGLQSTGKFDCSGTLKDTTLLSFFQYIAVSAGVSESDFKKMREILALSSALKYICIDVANGYSENFVQHVKDVRAAFPKHVIMVSLEIVYREG